MRVVGYRCKIFISGIFQALLDSLEALVALRRALVDALLDEADIPQALILPILFVCLKLELHTNISGSQKQIMVLF